MERAPGTTWPLRLRRLLDLIDTPRDYGSAGSGLRLDATGRRLEWVTQDLGRAVGYMQTLPGLRGLWPMSVFDASGNAQDVSGHGHHLTYNGNPTFNVDGVVPYIDLDGTGDYLSRADESDLDILGSEAYVASPGLTMGGWFYFDDASPATTEILIGKYSTSAASFAYWLRRLTSTNAGMYVRSSGVTYNSGVATGVGADAWKFIIGRYVPSTSVAIYVSGVWTTNTTSIPASINNSSAPLTIGNEGGGSLELDGRASLCFLCASALSDAMIDRLYSLSRYAFEGVSS